MTTGFFWVQTGGNVSDGIGPGSPCAKDLMQSLNVAVQTWPKLPWQLTRKPEFIKVKQILHVIFFLGVIFLGYPQPTVQWLQNGNPMTESSRTTMEQEDDGLCALILADLNPSDSGVYTCKASNKQGEATCSAKLKVEMWPQEQSFWRETNKLWAPDAI